MITAKAKEAAKDKCNASQADAWIKYWEAYLLASKIYIDEYKASEALYNKEISQ
jgi:hypothetical protein